MIIDQEARKENESVEINAMRMKKTVAIDVTQESLSEYLMSRYPERRSDDFPGFLTVLAAELRDGSLGTIADVHKILERTKKAVRLFEAEYPRSQLVGNEYSAIEIVILSISLLDEDFFISWPNVLDDCPPEKLEEYRKIILPETDESQPMED